MKEAYYEESASCQNANKQAKIYTAIKVAAIVLFVIGGFQLSLAFNVINGVWEATVSPETKEIYWQTRALLLVGYFLSDALFIGIGVLLWFMKNRFNQSYDYLFVEDELRVSRVYNGKKRKFLRSFKADQILKMGRCEADSFERTCAGLTKKQIRFYTPNSAPAEGKEFFYLLYSTSIEKAVYIIEAKKEMMDYLVFAAGRSKWEAK